VFATDDVTTSTGFFRSYKVAAIVLGALVIPANEERNYAMALAPTACVRKG